MSTKRVRPPLMTILVWHFYFLLMITADPHRKLKAACKFDRIYQFGDSISDTGNSILVDSSTVCGRLPYGQNFLKGGTPTGRCSNGLLMIDFIAMAFNVSLLPPIKNEYGDFRNGANFAVAGATALPPAENMMARTSLDAQLRWMVHHFRSIFKSHTDRVKKLRKALFVVGEIGGNDYNAAIFNGNSMAEVRAMLPKVVDAIIKVVGETIRFGAKTVLVPGNFPIGCFPLFKAAAFATNTKYDQNRCIKHYNAFARSHNKQLKLGIKKLKKRVVKSNVTIVYLDYYKAYIALLRSFKSRRFNYEDACCGTGGKYNYGGGMCGTGGATTSCQKPERYISWDGIHLTQEAYKRMSASLLRRLGCKFRCRFLK